MPPKLLVPGSLVPHNKSKKDAEQMLKEIPIEYIMNFI